MSEMTVWLCYQASTGKAAVQINDGDVPAAVSMLSRLFDHGLPTGGTWFCETGAH